MKKEDLEILKQGLSVKDLDVSTIHLFCLCPMGEDQGGCAVTSYGKLFAANNINLNDASILHSPHRINPQATIMALARRNTENFL